MFLAFHLLVLALDQAFRSDLDSNPLQKKKGVLRVLLKTHLIDGRSSERPVIIKCYNNNEFLYRVIFKRYEVEFTKVCGGFPLVPTITTEEGTALDLFTRVSEHDCTKTLLVDLDLGGVINVTFVRYFPTQSQNIMEEIVSIIPEAANVGVKDSAYDCMYTVATMAVLMMVWLKRRGICLMIEKQPTQLCTHQFWYEAFETLRLKSERNRSVRRVGNEEPNTEEYLPFTYTGFLYKLVQPEILSAACSAIEILDNESCKQKLEDMRQANSRGALSELQKLFEEKRLERMRERSREERSSLCKFTESCESLLCMFSRHETSSLCKFTEEQWEALTSPEVVLFTLLQQLLLFSDGSEFNNNRPFQMQYEPFQRGTDLQSITSLEKLFTCFLKLQLPHKDFDDLKDPLHPGVGEMLSMFLGVCPFVENLPRKHVELCLQIKSVTLTDYYDYGCPDDAPISFISKFKIVENYIKDGDYERFAQLKRTFLYLKEGDHVRRAVSRIVDRNEGTTFTFGMLGFGDYDDGLLIRFNYNGKTGNTAELDGCELPNLFADDEAY